MLLVTELKAGSTIRLEDKLYRVMEVTRHAGTGQMQGFMELKLKELPSGHITDKRLKMNEKVEEVELSKRYMEYIYTSGDELFFMDSENYEQVPVHKTRIETDERFLKEGIKVTVELLNGQPIVIQFPKVIELKITSTSAGRREGSDNTLKSATLENGIDILVPQFIEAGEIVRIDTEKIKYIDRVPIKKV